MATKIIIRGGQATAVYDDRFRPLLECLGVLKVERASNVEFDEASGDWIATLPDGTEIARGKSRDAVIQAEVAYLEERL